MASSHRRQIGLGQRCLISFHEADDESEQQAGAEHGGCQQRRLFAETTGRRPYGTQPRADAASDALNWWRSIVEVEQDARFAGLEAGSGSAFPIEADFFVVLDWTPAGVLERGVAGDQARPCSALLQGLIAVLRPAFLGIQAGIRAGLALGPMSGTTDKRESAGRNKRSRYSRGRVPPEEVVPVRCGKRTPTAVGEPFQQRKAPSRARKSVLSPGGSARLNRKWA